MREQNIIKIIRCIAHSDAPLTFSELSNVCGLNIHSLKSYVYYNNIFKLINLDNKTYISLKPLMEW